MSASIIESISISGSRKFDGTANDSGKVWAFLPNSTTPAVLYADPEATVVITQPIILDQGGRVSPSDAPDGVFTPIPIRLYIEDSATNAVSDLLFTPSTATNTTLDNDGWTGPTEDDAWASLFDSLGGVDGTYKESGGATSRTVKSKFSEISISVKDFGAVGNGTTIDTTAIQAAMNRVQALGGGECYFPPGTYLIDQALSLTSATGITLRGNRRATTITSNNASANIFTFATSSNRCEVKGFRFTHTSSTTGAAVSAAGGTNFRVSDVDMSGGGFAYGADFSGATNWTIVDSDVRGTTRAIRSNVSGDGHYLVNTNVTQPGGGAGAAIEINGGGHYYTIVGGNVVATSTGILFNAAFTGSYVTVVGTVLSGLTTPYDTSGLSVDPQLRRIGDGVSGYTVDVASGGTVTPNRSLGHQIRIRGTTTGVAYTIAAPTPKPRSTADGLPMYDEYLRLSFYNNAGGAVTGWTLNAIYHKSAAPSTVDGEVTTYVFFWDPDAAVWREQSRVVTT